MQYILAYSCDKGRTIDNGFLICLHAYVVEGWIIISILIYIDQIVDMNSNNFIEMNINFMMKGGMLNMDELSKKFLCFGVDGMNVFQGGKTKVTKQNKEL
jgi:hypothetical protein